MVRYLLQARGVNGLVDRTRCLIHFVEPKDTADTLISAVMDIVLFKATAHLPGAEVRPSLRLN